MLLTVAQMEPSASSRRGKKDQQQQPTLQLRSHSSRGSTEKGGSVTTESGSVVQNPSDAPLKRPRDAQAQVGTPKKQRRVKIKKDNQKPSRPLSAYNAFFREERVNWLAENGANGQAESKSKAANRFLDMGKEIGAKWKSLNAEQREKFNQIAQDDMVRYRSEMEKYNEMMIRSTEIGRKALEGRIQHDSRTAHDKTAPVWSHSLKEYPQTSLRTASGGFSAGEELNELRQPELAKPINVNDDEEDTKQSITQNQNSPTISRINAFSACEHPAYPESHEGGSDIALISRLIDFQRARQHQETEAATSRQFGYSRSFHPELPTLLSSMNDSGGNHSTVMGSRIRSEMLDQISMLPTEILAANMFDSRLAQTRLRQQATFPMYSAMRGTPTYDDAVQHAYLQQAQISMLQQEDALSRMVQLYTQRQQAFLLGQALERNSLSALHTRSSTIGEASRPFLSGLFEQGISGSIHSQDLHAASAYSAVGGELNHLLLQQVLQDRLGTASAGSHTVTSDGLTNPIVQLPPRAPADGSQPPTSLARLTGSHPGEVSRNDFLNNRSRRYG